MSAGAARIVLAALAFVSLGLPDGALGIAWPGLRDAFALPQSGLGLVLAAVSAGFVLSSNAAAWLLDRLGIGKLLAVSTGLVAAAAAGHGLAPSLTALLLAAVVLGLGSGAIDAGLNAYAAARFSPRHMNWLHAAYGLGAATGPIVLTAAIAAGGGYRVGYGTLALGLASFALLFWLTRHRWHEPSPGRPPPRTATPAGAVRGRAAGHVVAFLLYTGLEVAVGQWSFTVLREDRGLTAGAAGAWTTAYWASLCLGRIGIGVVADRLGPAPLVRGGVLAMLAGTIVFAAAPMPLAGLGLVLTGLGAAPVFPMLMSHTAASFEPAFAARLVGLQVSAAMLGALLLPGLAGAAADLTTLAAIAPLLAAATGLLAALAIPLVQGSARGRCAGRPPNAPSRASPPARCRD